MRFRASLVRPERPATLDGTATPAYEPQMFGSNGRGTSVQPMAAEADRRRFVVRCCILIALGLAYRGSFSTLHAWMGSPAFLVGLGICLVAAAWLGLRGALVAIVCIALVDRGSALRLAADAETSLIAGVIGLLVKLVLAGGLGLVV